MMIYETHGGLSKKNGLESKSKNENENVDCGRGFNRSIACNNEFKCGPLSTQVQSPPQYGAIFDSDAKYAKSSANCVLQCEFNVNENGNNIYDRGQICVHYTLYNTRASSLTKVIINIQFLPKKEAKAAVLMQDET